MPRTKRMTKADLADRLNEIAANFNGDPEAAHGFADSLLIAYINDHEVTKAFDRVEKWYA
jgi:hypothetical protein